MNQIRVVCALSVRDGRLFAALRGESMSHAGQWELPGGKIRDGETPEDALRRELHEEFGVKANPGELFATHQHRYPDFAIELAAYRCTMEGPIACVEHSAVRWVSPQEALALGWSPADLPLVRAWAESAQ
jgi:8-oxo-dGTP diphosphatase